VNVAAAVHSVGEPYALTRWIRNERRQIGTRPLGELFATFRYNLAATVAAHSVGMYETS